MRSSGSVLRVVATATLVAGLSAPAAQAQHRHRHGDQSARASGEGFSAPATHASARGRVAQPTPTTWDTDPAVEARVNAILAQMTIEEKADLATGKLNN